ncbi:hypothetical protein Q763_01445 [Flavobacterium beibuense F44-8]|uniref:Annexin n=1 Tax=Flavobacterium beibuense F44-8 TaxID=1406840 RepID=A0A0A2LWP8_9FLAO|nr:hypothetical protein [Flavobacterium beibuense]KGO84434.1 hypothetical protein Q763_01445 [Flavobacterium beibuense F44-8]
MDAKTKKIIIATTGVIAAGTILYFVLRKKTDNSGGECDPTGNGQNCIQVNPSVVADSLYNAMKESGTDEEAILLALKNVNAIMFDQVIKKFGKQSYNKYLGNQINLTPWNPLPLEPLPVWLKSELTTSEYNKLKLKYPQLT